MRLMNCVLVRWFMLLMLLAPVNGFAANNIKKGPYLIYPNNPTKMTVLLQADGTASTCSIRWGTSTAYTGGSKNMEAFGDRKQYRATITGLSVNTLYYYEVNLDGGLRTGTFRTAPAATATSTVIYAVGDSRFAGKSAGYSGTGYVDYKNDTGDYIEWTINAPSASTAEIIFGYAPSSGDRPLEIKVNGIVVAPDLSFPATGSKTTWGETAPLTVDLVSGINTIRATAIGSSGEYVDYLDVTISGTSSTTRYEAEDAIISGARSVNSADQNKIMSAMLTDMDASVATRQTVWMHVGDFVSSGDTESGWENEFFNRSYPKTLAAMRRLPVMGCRGNHEQTGRLYGEFFPYNQLVETSVSPAPASDTHYYSFDYGPVHFAVLDDYISRSVGSTQYNWLIADLKASTKAWTILMFHEPAYSAGGHGDNETNRSLLNDLKNAGFTIDMVLSGHNHYYARCAAGGVVHLTVGGGGVSLRSPDLNYSSHIVTAIKALSFARLDVSGNTLDCTVKNDSGAVIDSFAIAKNQGPPPPPTSTPTAKAGPDQTVTDSNGDGSESVSVNVQSGTSSTTRYEAEDAIISGAVTVNSNAGYSGTGYVDYKNDTGRIRGTTCKIIRRK